MQSIPPTTANKQTQAQKKRGSMARKLLGEKNYILFLHDSRDCPETAVSLLHQKRLGSGSEPTNKQDGAHARTVT